MSEMTAHGPQLLPMSDPKFLTSLFYGLIFKSEHLKFQRRAAHEMIEDEVLKICLGYNNLILSQRQWPTN